MKKRIKSVLAQLAMAIIIGSFVTLPVLTSEIKDPITALFITSCAVFPTIVLISWLDKVVGE